MRTMRTIVQIFVAFSEILNFTLGLARNSNLDVNLTYNIVSVTIFICYFFRMRLSNVNRIWNETQIISTLPWLPWPQLTCKTGHIFLQTSTKKHYSDIAHNLFYQGFKIEIIISMENSSKWLFLFTLLFWSTYLVTYQEASFTIDFLYYEERLVSSNLNSNLLLGFIVLILMYIHAWPQCCIHM